MNYDHLIFVSYFMNEEQWKNINGDRDVFRMLICQTIFHEMIHVIEEETNTDFQNGHAGRGFGNNYTNIEGLSRQYRAFFEITLGI